VKARSSGEARDWQHGGGGECCGGGGRVDCGDGIAARVRSTANITLQTASRDSCGKKCRRACSLAGLRARVVVGAGMRF
jgi:hypothetical protein